MKSAMPPTLPAELIDRIIDFLHHDKRSLADCSLVSKLWVTTARYHLFSSHRIFCGKDIDQTYTERLELAPDGALSCVKQISLTGVRHQAHRFSHVSSILCATVVDIIQRFPNAVSIVLTDLQVVSTPVDRDIPMTQPPRSLRSLMMDRIHFCPSPSLIANEKSLLETLLRAFTSIEALHIIDNIFQPIEGDYGTPVLVPILSWRLRALESGGLSTLVRFRPSTPLHAFSFDPVSLNEFSALDDQRVVNNFYNLQTLEFCIDRCVTKYFILNPTSNHVPASEWRLTLTAFPTVNHFIINAFPKFGSCGDAFIIAIIDILSFVAKPNALPEFEPLSSLRTLTLKLPIFRPPVSEDRWTELCSTLCLLKETRHIQDMRIQLRVDIPKRKLEDAQRKMMEGRMWSLFLDGTLRYEVQREFF